MTQLKENEKGKADKDVGFDIMGRNIMTHYINEISTYNRLKWQNTFHVINPK